MPNYNSHQLKSFYKRECKHFKYLSIQLFDNQILHNFQVFSFVAYATPPLTPPQKGRGTRSSFNLLIFNTLVKVYFISKVQTMNRKHHDHIPLPFWGGVRGGVLYAQTLLSKVVR